MKIKIAYLPATDDAVTDWEFSDYTQAVEFMESRVCNRCMCRSKEELAQYMEGYSDDDIDLEYRYTALPEDYDCFTEEDKLKALWGTACGCEYTIDWEAEE